VSADRCRARHAGQPSQFEVLWRRHSRGRSRRRPPGGSWVTDQKNGRPWRRQTTEPLGCRGCGRRGPRGLECLVDGQRPGVWPAFL